MEMFHASGCGLILFLIKVFPSVRGMVRVLMYTNHCSGSSSLKLLQLMIYNHFYLIFTVDVRERKPTSRQFSE